MLIKWLIDMKPPAHPSGGIFPGRHIQQDRILADAGVPLTPPLLYSIVVLVSTHTEMGKALKRRLFVANKAFLVARPTKVPHAVLERR